MVKDVIGKEHSLILNATKTCELIVKKTETSAIDGSWWTYPGYETKHLGVIISSSMNFKSQVEKVIQEVKWRVAGAIKLMKGTNQKIVKTCIVPVIMYALHIYDHTWIRGLSSYDKTVRCVSCGGI